MTLTDQNTDSRKITLLRIFSSRPLLSLEDDKRYFTGFKEEFKKTLLAIKTYENTLIIGDRGSGKSSFLHHIFYHLQKHREAIPIKINVLRMERFDQTAFLSNLLIETVDTVNQYQSTSTKVKKILVKMAESGLLGIPGSNVGISFSSDSSIKMGSGSEINFSKKDDLDILYERLQTFVKQLRKHDINLCVLLDDTDKVDGNLIWSTFRGIRDMLWELRISIIITALPNQVSEITKPPLDHFFPYWIKLKPFDNNQIKELLKKRISDANVPVKISDDAIQLAVNRTQGNLRSIVEIFKNVFENGELPKIVEREHIENVGLPYSTSLSDTERAVCNYLVHNPHSSASSEDFVKKLGVSRSRLAQVLNSLKDQGLITSNKEGKKTKYFITRKGIMKRDQEN